MKYSSLRKDYENSPLFKKDLSKNPVNQFIQWFEKAKELDEIEPNAMCLATSNKKGEPSSRIVLMKEMNDKGIVFFTNYESKKGKEIEENPFCSVTFWWRTIERQVIISGKAEKITKEESEQYFHKRPRNSQLGALASRQDTPLKNRDELKKTFDQLQSHYKNQEIPLPDYWGGFRITPKRFEFWSGQPSRLHDRFCYTKATDGWVIERLSP